MKIFLIKVMFAISLCFLTPSLHAMMKSEEVDYYSEHDLKRCYGLASVLRNQKWDPEENKILEDEVLFFHNATKSHLPHLFETEEYDLSDPFKTAKFMQTNDDVLTGLQEHIIESIYNKQRKPFDGLPVGLIQNNYVDKKGNTYFEDEEGNFAGYYTSSIATGILINESTVLTANHVLNALTPCEGYEIAQTFWPIHSQSGEELSIGKTDSIEDPLEVPSLKEGEKRYSNMADIGLGFLSEPVNIKEFKYSSIILSDKPPIPGEELSCITLERLFVEIPSENEEEIQYKAQYTEFEVKQPKFFTYEDLIKSGLTVTKDKQKRYFVENYMMPSTSGASVLVKKKNLVL